MAFSGVGPKGNQKDTRHFGTPLKERARLSLPRAFAGHFPLAGPTPRAPGALVAVGRQRRGGAGVGDVDAQHAAGLEVRLELDGA